ncbi:S-adenosyl-L-methionine-dependent methyltransferase [Mycotypha africana]|uniref:S-adenosyl-L-methionine-dependent methyltransferase n=1 Tax=Mycotypha africana TaxID=64632 RepID=UPI0023001DBD|nr:S-adenosyl-L-methionine-dependent methyltransferase [Mycotypha africana]KAI8975106.1 S-adenosyl-L-methionine-dependent methyltransferase [Mycotypha africana]
MVTKRRKKLAPSVFNIYRPNLGDKGIESFKASSSSCSVSSSESSSSYTVSLPISDENEHKNLKEATTIADQDYIILEGRKYLNTPGNHFYSPCDDEEADRMVMMHFLIKYAFGGNWNAPIQSILQFKSSRENPSKVLDVGCGTGTWVLEMASEFPHAEIYGIDVRAMFPHTSNPSNTHFIQYDYLKRLPYPDNTFDYIRMRLMLAFTTEKQFVRLLSEMHRVLKPLGYIEILDCEYRIHHNGVETAKLEEGSKRGRPMH